MKNWGMLIWLPQFGISIVFPMIGFIMLAVWLQEHWGWGSWVLWAAIFCGLFTSAVGVRDTIKAMTMADHKKEKKSPPLAFNSHD